MSVKDKVTRCIFLYILILLLAAFAPIVCSPNLPQSIEECLPVEGPAQNMASAVAVRHQGEASVRDAANEHCKVISCISPSIRSHHVFPQLSFLHYNSSASYIYEIQYIHQE